MRRLTRRQKAERQNAIAAIMAVSVTVIFCAIVMVALQGVVS